MVAASFCQRSPKKLLEITEAEFLQATYYCMPGTKLHSLCLTNSSNFLNMFWENHLEAVGLTGKISGSRAREVTETLLEWIRTAWVHKYGHMFCWWWELHLNTNVSFWHCTDTRQEPTAMTAVVKAFHYYIIYSLSPYCVMFDFSSSKCLTAHLMLANTTHQCVCVYWTWQDGIVTVWQLSYVIQNSVGSVVFMLPQLLIVVSRSVE